MEAIKKEHDAFMVYGSYRDFGLEKALPVVEIHINNGRERSNLPLSAEEVEQAIEMLKEGLKSAQKFAKKADKQNKRDGKLGF